MVNFFVKITLLRRHFIYPWNGGSSRCLAWDGKLTFSTPSCHKWLWKYENLQTWKLPKKAGCDAFSQIQSHILRNLERKAGKLIYWSCYKSRFVQCYAMPSSHLPWRIAVVRNQVPDTVPYITVMVEVGHGVLQ